MVTESNFEYIGESNSGTYRYKLNLGNNNRGDLYDFLVSKGVTSYSNAHTRETLHKPNIHISLMITSHGPRNTTMNSQYISFNAPVHYYPVQYHNEPAKFDYRKALNGLADHISTLESKVINETLLGNTRAKELLAAIRMVEFIRDIAAVGRKRIAMTENPYSERFQYLELK